jgi:undecaprenyl-diphosphatase
VPGAGFGARLANLMTAARVLLRAPRFGDLVTTIHQRPGPWILAASVPIVLAVLLMPTLDVPAIVAARDLNRNWVVQGFDVYTDTGKSGWMLWPLGVLVIALALLSGGAMSRITQGRIDALIVRAGFLFVAIGLPGLFTTITKRFIGRARPFVGGAPDAFLYSPFAFHVHYASMPSGHTTTAFAAAIAVGALWPRTRVVMWIYAVLVAVSRVMVTAHHPSDTVIGALVGIFGALLVRQWFAVRGLGFVVTPEGRVQPKAGIAWRRLGSHMTAFLRRRPA